jgi:hypothetical protein
MDNTLKILLAVLGLTGLVAMLIPSSDPLTSGQSKAEKPAAPSVARQAPKPKSDEEGESEEGEEAEEDEKVEGDEEKEEKFPIGVNDDSPPSNGPPRPTPGSGRNMDQPVEEGMEE